MIRGATDTDYQEGLQQDADAEGVHGEARRINVDAQYLDYALSVVALCTFRAISARGRSIGHEDAILSG
jgi:hypothetical protein